MSHPFYMHILCFAEMRFYYTFMQGQFFILNLLEELNMR